MSKQRGEALVFRSGAPVEMVTGGNARPVSSKPATVEQIRSLFAEVLGGEELEGVHAYRGPFGAVSITVQAGPGGALAARIEPAQAAAQVSGAEAPLELAVPARAAAPSARVSAGGAPKALDELFHQMLDLRASARVRDRRYAFRYVRDE